MCGGNEWRSCAKLATPWKWKALGTEAWVNKWRKELMNERMKKKYIYIYTYKYIHIYIYLNLYMCVSIRICKYVYIYVCAYVCSNESLGRSWILWTNRRERAESLLLQKASLGRPTVPKISYLVLCAFGQVTLRFIPSIIPYISLKKTDAIMSHFGIWWPGLTWCLLPCLDDMDYYLLLINL